MKLTSVFRSVGKTSANKVGNSGGKQTLGERHARALERFVTEEQLLLMRLRNPVQDVTRLCQHKPSVYNYIDGDITAQGCST